MKKFVIIAAAVLLACSCGLLATSSSSSSSSSSANRSSSQGGIRVSKGVGTETITFNSLPTSVDELQKLDITDPYVTAALTLAAMMQWESNNALCIEMLEYLNGPNNVSNYEKQFYRDRLTGKQYKIPSFFAGATPDNNYTPSKPYKVTVTTNSYSFQSKGWATMYIKSGGADNPRPVKLRQKESTGEWFYTEITYLADIRTPASADPWR